MNKVEKVVSSPLKFCYCLKLPMVRCDGIDRDKHNVWEKIREISSVWFDNTPYPTWEPVVKALICLDKRGAAKELADETGVDFDKEQ